MSTSTNYQRLQTVTMDVRPQTTHDQRVEQASTRRQQITSTGERKISESSQNMLARPEGTVTSAYFRRLEQRANLLERKVQDLEEKQEEQKSSPTDRIAQCSGRCVSVTLRALASPFIWAGNGIARACGCKK